MDALEKAEVPRADMLAAIKLPQTEKDEGKGADGAGGAVFNCNCNCNYGGAGKAVVRKDQESRRRLGSLMQPVELTPRSSMNPADPYGLTFQELVQTVKDIEEEMMSMMVEYKKTVYGATDVIPRTRANGEGYRGGDDVD